MILRSKTCSTSAKPEVKVDSPLNPVEDKTEALIKVIKQEILDDLESQSFADEGGSEQEFLPNQVVWARLTQRERYWPAIVLDLHEWDEEFFCPADNKLWVYWLGWTSSEMFSLVKVKFIREFYQNFDHLFDEKQVKSAKRYAKAIKLTGQIYFELTGWKLDTISHWRAFDFKKVKDPMQVNDVIWNKVMSKTAHRLVSKKKGTTKQSKKNNENRPRLKAKNGIPRLTRLECTSSLQSHSKHKNSKHSDVYKFHRNAVLVEHNGLTVEFVEI